MKTFILQTKMIMYTHVTIWLENRKYSHAGKYLTIKQWRDSCSLEGQKEEFLT